MRFSRRRSSLSFPSSAAKTALNANHACAFLPHSAVPAHRRPQEVQMQNASTPKMDASWTDCTSIRLTEPLRSQVKGDAGKCASLFFLATRSASNSSAAAAVGASRLFRVELKCNRLPPLAQHLHLMSSAFWSFECSFLFFFSQVLRLPSLYF